MRREARPMLLFVTREGCLYCVRMKQQTYADAGVASEITRSFVATTVDGLQQQSLVRQLGVRVYPTTVIISPQNEVLDVIDGFVDSNVLRSRLAAVTSRTGMVPRPSPR